MVMGEPYPFSRHMLPAMDTFEGASTADIDAPLERVWDLVRDVERAPTWQGGLSGMTAILRDAEDRAIVCETATDAKVTTVKTRIRFTYNGPTELSWVQEKGPLKAVEGHWRLEDLGGERTRATYWLKVDLGRLGMVIRGPLVEVLRAPLVGARAAELKRAVEGSV
jgi:ribosome-associated toxin RatA of RatAB toxin-antitoxin module